MVPMGGTYEFLFPVLPGDVCTISSSISGVPLSCFAWRCLYDTLVDLRRSSFLFCLEMFVRYPRRSQAFLFLTFLVDTRFCVEMFARYRGYAVLRGDVCTISWIRGFAWRCLHDIVDTRCMQDPFHTLALSFVEDTESPLKHPVPIRFFDCP